MDTFGYSFSKVSASVSDCLFYCYFFILFYFHFCCYKWNPFRRGVYTKGKNLLRGRKCSPFLSRYATGFWQSYLSCKCIWLRKYVEIYSAAFFFLALKFFYKIFLEGCKTTVMVVKYVVVQIPAKFLYRRRKLRR